MGESILSGITGQDGMRNASARRRPRPGTWGRALVHQRCPPRLPMYVALFLLPDVRQDGLAATLPARKRSAPSGWTTAAVLGTDGPLGLAVRGRGQHYGHVAVAVRCHYDPPPDVAGLFQSARPGHLTTRHREGMVPQRLVAV